MKLEIYEPIETGPKTGAQQGGLPGERRSMISFPERGAAAAGLGIIGDTLSHIGQRMQQAEEVSDLSQAMIKQAKGFADIYRDIQQDPSLTEASVDEIERSFDERATSLKSSISENMKQARAKSAFEIRFEEGKIKGLLKVRDFGRQRMISRSRAQTDAELQVLTDNLINTGDLESITDGQAIIDGKVKAGIFSPEEGRQLSQRFKRDAVIGYYERLIENPATAPAAYQELTRDKEPGALSMVDERTKTALVDKARRASAKAIEDSYENTVLSDVQTKFKGDPLRAIAHLENPKNYKALSFEGRAKLISFLYAQENRKRLMAEAQRIQQAKADRAGIFASLIKNELDKAIILTARSQAIDPKEKMELFDKIQKYPWKTSPSVYSQTVEQIHAGIIKEPEQIDRLRGRGLSNDDADKLTGKLGAPRYKEPLKYAANRFKLLFPAKDDLDKHVRYLAFVEKIDSDIQKQNADRAKAGRPPITEKEAREIVDAYLDETTQEDAFLWFDDDYRPVERWLEGKEPFGTNTKKPERPPIPNFEKIKMSTIPHDVQEAIADQLFESGYRITADNIKRVYDKSRKADMSGQHFKVRQ